MLTALVIAAYVYLLASRKERDAVRNPHGAERNIGGLMAPSRTAWVRCWKVLTRSRRHAVHRRVETREAFVKPCVKAA